METVMRSALGSLSLIVLSSTLLLAQAQVDPTQQPLAFTHVTVIDATGSPAQPDMTVVVTGNRINALGKFGAVPIPPNAQVTDARGRFMIPGLQEMHTHAFIRARKSFPLYTLYLFIANGVTGIRDFGSTGVKDDFGDYPFRQDEEWRQAISAGNILGPRVNMSLTVVNGPRAEGYPRTWLTVADAAQARDMVRFLKDQGADFIKEYDQLSRESYFAMADEAKKQGIPLAGHVPILVTAAEASDAGQRTLEHNYGVLTGCSSKESEMMQKERDLFGPGKGSMRGLLSPEDVKALTTSYDEGKCKALFAKFVKNSTFVVPSMLRARGAGVSATDPRVVKWFSPALREYSYPSSRTPRPPNPEIVEARSLMYKYHSGLVKEMQRSGVKMLVGTDDSFFGTSLHEELVEFVKAGLTPMEALQVATRNAAEYYGKLDSSGTVEKGKQADLVLLDADPLASIENTQKISAVVINGRLLGRQELNRLLAAVESPNHIQR
ncbi:MAG TPA: amidohydrolase family protein [Vicinamibacterales bacterium]|jgi:imidazolonepropionase-like amidohydrolase|nr:amidohydrolase family protein [Vicinamibacterales bacterium]